MDKAHYQKKLNTEFVRAYPNEEGQWKIVSTGEIANAIEDEDIQGYPLMSTTIEHAGRFYSVDFKNEIFVKLNEAGELLA